MVIEPRLFVAAQPAGTAPALLAQFVDVQPGPDQPRDELPELWRRQRRGPDLSPAASPRGGTTGHAAPRSGGGAPPASSSPGSRPGPPPPWPAPGIPRCDAPPSRSGPARPAASPPPRTTGSSPTCTYDPLEVPV